MEIVERFKKTDGDVVYVRHLTPNTTENRSIVALELHSDKQSKKPGILIIGGNVSHDTYNLLFKIVDENVQITSFSRIKWYDLGSAKCNSRNCREVTIRPRLPNTVFQ